MTFPRWTGGCRGLAAGGAARVDVGGRDRSGEGQQPGLAEHRRGRRSGPAAVAAGAPPRAGAAAPAGAQPRRISRAGVRHRGHRWAAPGLDARAQPALSWIGAVVRPLGDHRRPRAAGLPAVQDRRPRLRRADLPGSSGPGPGGARSGAGRAGRRGAPSPRSARRAQGRPAAAARPAARTLSGPGRSRRARPGAKGRQRHRAGGARLRRGLSPAGRPRCVRCALEPTAGSWSTRRSSGSTGGGPACPHRPTRRPGPRGWAAAWPAGAH